MGPPTTPSGWDDSIPRIGNVDPAVSVGAPAWPENAAAAETICRDGTFQMQAIVVLTVHRVDGQFACGDFERHGGVRLEYTAQHLAAIDRRAGTVDDPVNLKHAF